MRHEVQVHFENSGQFAWYEDILDPEDWLLEVYNNPVCTGFDEETERYIGFSMDKVNAIILTPKSHEETDLFRRAYASQKGHEQQDDRYEYKGNGEKRLPQETGDRRIS